MTSTYRATLDELVELLRDIKPGLGDTPIEPGQSVVEDLGLDSLDLLQLSRKITRQFGADFDLDSWNAEADEHHRSVESILDAVGKGGGNG
jgi:acyl carrier protein